MNDALQQFRGALIGRGIVPPDEIVADGQLHRCDAEGKNGKGDAAYVLHSDGIPAGGLENWRDGLGWQNWRADVGRKLTPAEEASHRARVEAMRLRRKADTDARQREARELCALTWDKAQLCDPAKPHPYLVKKGVQAHGLKVAGNGRLLIPVRDADGTLHSLQFIDADGTKRFKTGGRKHGCYFAIGTPDGVLCIAEGYATGASIHEATGHAVAVAFDAGNLLPVALALREKLPDVRIVVCADDDWKTAGNPGLTKAREAAQAAGGLVAIPDFGPDRPGDVSDLNDLATLQGAESVVRCIESAIEPPENEPASSDSGAPAGESSSPHESDDACIARLSRMSAVEYERSRAVEAKRLGMRTGVLDKIVQRERQGNTQEGIGFDDVEPWPEPVAGDVLLNDIANTITRFIVCKPETAHAAALWVSMTWFIDVVQVAPLAVISAPEKRCGKSQLLTLLGKLSCRSVVASNITPAALFRVIDAWKPALMIDEADAFMRENEELRGIINSGHTRDSAYVVRVVGDEHTPKQFSTWGCKAIAGIGHLADTLMDRAVVLELRRKLPHENVERLRHAEPDLFDHLASRLCRFAQDNREAVRRARPELPQALHDRAQDNWEPLLAIADVAGGVWPEQARRAALDISGATDEGGTIGNELLSDIMEVLETKRVERIGTTELIEALCADDEKPWATYNRGKPVSPRQIAKRLKEYGIASKNLRAGYGVTKGFERIQFEDVFLRYLATPPDLSATPLHSHNHAGYSVADKKTHPLHRDLSATPLHRYIFRPILTGMRRVADTYPLQQSRPRPILTGM
jgi:putative DNA primase/helicase